MNSLPQDPAFKPFQALLANADVPAEGFSYNGGFCL
jgi:hypothetical protein